MSEMADTQLSEYKICQQRGHSSRESYGNGFGPQIYICRYCGVHYWDEVKRHESNVPDEEAHDDDES